MKNRKRTSILVWVLIIMILQMGFAYGEGSYRVNYDVNKGSIDQITYAKHRSPTVAEWVYFQSGDRIGAEHDLKFVATPETVYEVVYWSVNDVDQNHGQGILEINDLQEDMDIVLILEEKSHGIDSDYYYDIIGDEVYITGYKGKDSNLVIPRTIEDKPVKYIEAEAFKDRTFITKVVIPDTVTEIRDSAFRGCSNLSTVIFKSKTAPNFYPYCFNDIAYNAKGHVPAGSEGYYIPVSEGNPFWNGKPLSLNLDVAISPGNEPLTSRAVIAGAEGADIRAYIGWTNKKLGDAPPEEAFTYISGTDLSDVAVYDILYIFEVKNNKIVNRFSKNLAKKDINYENPFAGGDGSTDHPYQIETAEQLSYVGGFSRNYDTYEPNNFILNNDIDLNVAPYDTGEGWEPVDLAGTFDGNGKILSNLMINRPEEYSLGLFSNAGSQAVIKNLGIVNAQIKGKEEVGILVGNANNAHIEEVYVTGSVEGDKFVGGLVGKYGFAAYTIKNSYSRADVRASGVLGGLVGYMEGSAIKNSYSAAEVQLQNPDDSDAWFKDGGTWASYVGGLLGANNPDDRYDDKSNLFVRNYYDVQVSGRSDAVGAVGKNTEQMKTKDTYLAGTGEEIWDFENVWDIDPKVNDGYPYLQIFEKESSEEEDSGGSSGGSRSSDHGDSSSNDVEIYVNGKVESAGIATTREEGNRSTTIIAVDEEKLEKKLKEEGKNALVTIPVKTQSHVVVGEFNGPMVKKMEDQEATVEIRTEGISYFIPSGQISTGDILDRLGDGVKLEDIKMEISIAKSPQDTVKVVKDSAKKEDLELVIPPVEFTVTYSHKGKTYEINKFDTYVQRVVRIPEGVDPEKITTGIVYNEDGAFSHVPTEVFEEDGIYYARINSLTNSIYSVVWNPIMVKSVENHWSKVSVNDMASRLVIKNPEEFKPDEYITRGEFAEYITKALGVYRTGIAQAHEFTDVDVDNALADAIEAATEYGIIHGYPDKSFRPKALISREEAMAMYSKAMDVVELKELDNNKIENYRDRDEVSLWAYAPVKKVVSAGVFNGKTNETLNPKDTFTYAEAAAAIRNLLVEAELINQ